MSNGALLTKHNNKQQDFDRPKASEVRRDDAERRQHVLRPPLRTIAQIRYSDRTQRLIRVASLNGKRPSDRRNKTFENDRKEHGRLSEVDPTDTKQANRTQD